MAVAGILSRTGLERMRGRVADTRTRRELLARDLRRLPIVAHVFPSDANFLLVRTTDVQQFLARCAACHVVVRDRSDVPGLQDCIRISVGEAPALEALLAALCGEVPSR